MPRPRCHFITAMPPSSDGDHHVVSFPSTKVKNTTWWRGPTHHADPGRLLSFAKFERDRRQDDHRHRMVLNALAFIVIVVLIVIGVWLITNINDQDHTLLHTSAYQIS
jgi:hypothetical protein